MITFNVKAESLFELANILADLVIKIDAHLETQEEVIEFDEEGYYYDEAEDELFWVDFTTGEEFYYDEEADEWFACDEIVEFEEVTEDDQEVDFE
jgi:hypothetical protein